MDQRTPFGTVDGEEVTAFWQRFLASTGRTANTRQPEAWPFGDSVELADKLIDLVLYEGAPVPRVGDLEMATDGSMRPRAVLELTDVRIGPLSSVDERFAWDEGEGDRSLAYWVDAHTRFFSRFLPTIGVEFTSDMPTIFQRFDVIYQED